MTVGVRKMQRYQRWKRKPSRFGSTWLAMVIAGVKFADKDSQARILIRMSIGFIVGTCSFFYIISVAENLMTTPEAQQVANMAWWLPMLKNVLGIDLRGVTNLAEIRTLLWRSIFMLTMKVQLFWIMITVARVGPGLIANDLRTKALPIYFSRPLTPISYLFSKWMTVGVFIALIMVIPNLLSLILGTLITGGLQNFQQTLGLAADLLVSGFGIMLVAGMVVLALSCITRDRRYAIVGWFSVCILPGIAQATVYESIKQEATTAWLGSISLRGDIMILIEWLFDMRQAFKASGLNVAAFEDALLSPVTPIYPAIVLATITVVSAVFCYWKVVRFSRSAACA